MSVLDELHAIVTDLEDEGHAVAGKLRDVATRIKNDVEALVGHSESEVQALASVLVKEFAPQLATEGKAFLAEVVDVVGPALKSGKTDAVAILADAVAALRTLL